MKRKLAVYESAGLRKKDLIKVNIGAAARVVKAWRRAPHHQIERVYVCMFGQGSDGRQGPLIKQGIPETF